MFIFSSFLMESNASVSSSISCKLRSAVTVSLILLSPSGTAGGRMAGAQIPFFSSSAAAETAVFASPMITGIIGVSPPLTVKPISARRVFIILTDDCSSRRVSCISDMMSNAVCEAAQIDGGRAV
uniref:BioF protein n=1 Tax=Bacillus amyloliquefaciens TaxID=1390 RepID=Q70JY9_BACAM|nr:BioF protein [Bacillus velezensis FZB42]